MTHNPFPWLRFSLQVATLGVEAQSVVGLRAIQFASGGPAAERETFRMVGEKVAAFAESQAALLGEFIAGAIDRPPTEVVTPYLRRVRANHRRLSRAA
jgi:hypothetical protein